MRRKSKIPEFARFFKPPQLSPEQQLDNFFRRVELYDKPRNEIYQQFLSHCVSQRELKNEQIKDALWKFTESNVTFKKVYRIVDSAFSQNPLSSYGSTVLPPGGRFNIALKSLYTDFQCLYVASDDDTAYAEKFHVTSDSNDEDLTPSELALKDGVNSYASYRINVNISSILDLRKKESLHSFFSIVKDIAIPADFQKTARNLKMDPFVVVQDFELFYAMIMDPLYTRWSTWSDHPATSQWLGYYAMRAGIGGLLYPSCRNEDGYNIAIFPDNIPNSNTSIELIDSVPAVPESLKILNSKNCEYFTSELSITPPKIVMN